MLVLGIGQAVLLANWTRTNLSDHTLSDAASNQLKYLLDVAPDVLGEDLQCPVPYRVCVRHSALPALSTRIHPLPLYLPTFQAYSRFHDLLKTRILGHAPTQYTHHDEHARKNPS